MFSFIKRILGDSDKSSDLLQGMMERAQKHADFGAQIADDCLVNGLRKGEFVRLSEIVRHIAANHSYHAIVIKTGFLARMLQHVRTGEIMNVAMEGDDMVFVHEDHASRLLGGAAMSTDESARSAELKRAAHQEDSRQSAYKALGALRRRRDSND